MNRKNILSGCLFLALMLLTGYIIFHDNDIGYIWETIKNMNPFYLAAAVLTGLFFVSAEGFMICYLLRTLKCKISLGTCIRISFIGFFFSGITPSATGGQPMQIYYLKKSGQRIADSTVVLMTVALIYKLVLVLIGLGILIFCHPTLVLYLQNYLYLYYLGLLLNAGLVFILLFIMISPKCFHNMVFACEKILIKMRILKASEKRTQKLFAATDSYHEAVLFFLKHKKHIFVVTVLTFIQRFLVFFLTWLVYKGLGLSGESMLTVMMIQATVYIAVDMLPLPGSQGITELMYNTVFSIVFPGAYLTASMCVSRVANFYLPLIISGFIVILSNYLLRKKSV